MAQHRDIPDSERHELKGASSAVAGSVPVANGSGGTVFQKLSTANFTGAIPSGVPDLVLSTDGGGGFKAVAPVYGQFLVKVTGGSSNPTFTVDTIHVSGGMMVDGQAVRVPISGLYYFSTGTLTITSNESGALTGVGHPKLVNVNSGAVIIQGMNGIVNLDSSARYRLNGAGDLTLWRVST